MIRPKGQKSRMMRGGILIVREMGLDVPHTEVVGEKDHDVRADTVIPSMSNSRRIFGADRAPQPVRRELGRLSNRIRRGFSEKRITCLG